MLANYTALLLLICDQMWVKLRRESSAMSLLPITLYSCLCLKPYLPTKIRSMCCTFFHPLSLEALEACLVILGIFSYIILCYGFHEIYPVYYIAYALLYIEISILFYGLQCIWCIVICDVHIKCVYCHVVFSVRKTRAAKSSFHLSQ